MDIIQNLKILPLFRDVPEENIRNISERHFQLKHFNEGQIIALRTDRCDSLYILVKGLVKAEMFDHSGKVFKIEEMEAPQTLAEAFLFGKKNHFPVDVTALNEVSVLFIK